MKLLLFSYRNLMRNPKRTFFAISMMVAGFMAIVLFRAYTGSLMHDLTVMATQVQYTHLQVGNHNSLQGKPVEVASERLILDPIPLREKILKLPNVRKVAPRLYFFGLLSNETTSIAAQAVAIDLAEEAHLMSALQFTDGQRILPTEKKKILVSKTLADKIQIKAGDQVTIVANTVEGAINAVDVEVAGLVLTNLKEVDAWTFYMPLETAQKLMDTTAVERLGIYLRDDDSLAETANQVQSLLSPELGYRTWREMAELYNQTEAFFDVQNLVLSIIIFTLVFLSVLNILSQTVTERTGEIGTMRALGERRKDVVTLFLLEGLILAILGCLIGAFFSVIVATTLTALKIPITIPGAVLPVDLSFRLYLNAFLEAAGLTLVTALVATYFPARRAAGLVITESIRQNLE